MGLGAEHEVLDLGQALCDFVFSVIQVFGVVLQVLSTFIQIQPGCPCGQTDLGFPAMQCIQFVQQVKKWIGVVFRWIVKEARLGREQIVQLVGDILERSR